MRFNYTHSGKKIEDTPENERLLRDRKAQYQNDGETLGEFAPHIKRKSDKRHAKNRVAKKSRRQNRK